MSQIERATERLYEDLATRDELTDDEAKPLLEWAEQQIARLAEQGLGDDKFDEQFASLRKLLAGINRFTGRRAAMTDEERQTQLDAVATMAHTLGHSAPPESCNAYLQRQAGLDNAANVQAMLEALTTSSPSTAAPPSAEKPRSGGLQNLLTGLSHLFTQDSGDSDDPK